MPLQSPSIFAASLVALLVLYISSTNAASPRYFIQITDIHLDPYITSPEHWAHKTQYFLRSCSLGSSLLQWMKMAWFFFFDIWQSRTAGIEPTTLRFQADSFLREIHV
jgi:hypothetical protein